MIKPSRKVVTQNENPPFLPSPRFFSQSPAHQWTPGQSSATPPSTGATTSDQRRSRTRSSTASRQDLLSPVPPPPANLYDNGNTGSFNVDPGVPFLATAGPSETGSDRDSIEETPPRDRLVGQFVAGLKRAVTLRRRKEAQRLRDLEEGMGSMTSPTNVRDSGYAPSPDVMLPPVPVVSQPLPSSGHTLPARSVSTPLGERYHGPERGDGDKLPDSREDSEAGYVPLRTPHLSQQPSFVMSPVSLASPVSAQLEFGPGYAHNIPPSTPPRTDISFNTYLARFQELVQHVSSLPWMAKERVTTDYYPELQPRNKAPYPPAITWQSIGQSQVGYQLEFDAAAADAFDDSSWISHLPGPKRGSYGNIDLGAEFADRPRGTKPDLPLGPSGHIPPPPTTTQAPPSVHSSSNPPVLVMPPPPVNTIIITTPATNQWGPPPPSTWPPNATTTYTLPSSFAPPPGPRPRTTSTHRKSRFSIRSRSSAGDFGAHTTPARNSNSNPIPVAAIPNAEVWEDYPRYMTGYRPYEFTEHYYGTQYGTGVHNARPPVGGVEGLISSVPSMMSLK